MPLSVLVRAVCAGFLSSADDFVEDSIDLQRHLIRNHPETFIVRVADDMARQLAVPSEAATRNRSP